jgi:integrase
MRQLTMIVPHLSEPKNPRPIPPDVLDAIVAGMTSEPEPRRKFLRFLYLVGPRKGQVLRTRAEQFTPATGQVRWTDADTKTGLPHVVTYTGEALDVLLWFVANRDPSSPALFQEDGKPLTKDMLDGTWTRACKAAGLNVGRKVGGYTIHNLRHTYVSEAHDAGESPGVIMAHTGHIQEPTTCSAPPHERRSPAAVPGARRGPSTHSGRAREGEQRGAPRRPARGLRVGSMHTNHAHP